MASTITIGRCIVGADKLFFTIEEGQANDGNFAKAVRMIDRAAAAGADAIEFHLTRAADFYVKSDPGHALYRRREFSRGQIARLVARARRRGLEFIATLHSHRLVEFMTKVGCSAFSINASDITNPDMLDAVAGSGLPFFLCLPLATEREIEWAVGRIRRKTRTKFIMMHGQHVMAGRPSGVCVAETAFGYISTLQNKYRLPVGFIDHTSLTWVPAAAVAAGAAVVTKHMSESCSDRGPDWRICLAPPAMKQAIGWARDMYSSRQIREKQPGKTELQDRRGMRRSIVAARQLPVGQRILRQDLLFKRPGTGTCPSRYEEMLGGTLVRNLAADELITPADIKKRRKK